MNVETYIPSEILRPYIRKYMVIETADGRINRILPDTSFALAFRLKGQVNYLHGGSPEQLPFSVISGLRKTPRLVNYIENSATVIIHFKETGPAAFFKVPMYELFEQSISLEYFIPQTQISILEEELFEAQNNRQRIAVVERFLLSQFQPPTSDRLIDEALRNIYAAKGSLKIKELVRHLYVGQDAFEKRFRKATGTTPKQFSSIVRMKAVIGSIRQNHALADVTFGNGFFDQPHFNKEFRLFTGQTPTDFIKSAPLW
jgi:AraC-like DNA-binding protein